MIKMAKGEGKRVHAREERKKTPGFLLQDDEGIQLDSMSLAVRLFLFSRCLSLFLPSFCLPSFCLINTIHILHCLRELLLEKKLVFLF